MSKLSLYFSDSEMRTFLSMKGYNFAEINCWEMHSCYHNDVEYTDHKVEIAYKGESLVKELTDKRKGDVEDYSVKNLFYKEMKNCLLKL